MAQRRGPVMAWSGTLAGLGIAAATLIATVGRQPVSNLWFIISLVVAALALLIFVFAGLPDLFGWLTDGLRWAWPLLQRRRQLITDRWQYTSEGAKAPAAMSVLDLALPGTGYRIQEDRPPWIRFVVLVACSQISPDADASQLWGEFQKFLKNRPVTTLVNSLSAGGVGLWWTRWATSSAGVIHAVYSSGDEGDSVAAARLELPDGTTRQGRDQRYAMLILHFEPPGRTSPIPPRGPVSWIDHFLRALELPQAFAEFLAGPLGLSTAGVPPVLLGFRLEAQHDMTDFIDVTGLNQLPGARRTGHAIGYFIADPKGVSAASITNRMITDVLRYTLKVER